LIAFVFCLKYTFTFSYFQQLSTFITMVKKMNTLFRNLKCFLVSGFNQFTFRIFQYTSNNILF
ncbi:hypothetical protein C1X86_36510, partial [Pseudomonas sp. GP01-A3]